MDVNKSQIEEIMGEYDLDSLNEIKKIPRGYQSTNYKLTTKSGHYVFRIMYKDNSDDVEYILKIYNLLLSKGIPTAKVLKTKSGELYTKYDGEFICIQKFVPGKQIEDNKKAIPICGKLLGKIHSALSQINLEGREEHLCISSLKRSAKKYMPEEDLVKSKYEEVTEELNSIPLEKLTKQIIHSDFHSGHIHFKDGKLQGILDFGDAHPDYILYDIATTLMYYNLYTKDRKDEYLRFIRKYLKEFSLPKYEFKYLLTFLKIRFLQQVLYHCERIQEDILYGVNTHKDNLEGVKDGIEMLRQIDDIPPDFYYKAYQQSTD